MATQPDQLGDAHIGMLMTRDLAVAGSRFAKGHAIAVEDLPTLRRATQSINAVRLEEGDVPESVAVPRIVGAIRGPHTIQLPPVQGRVNIRSAVRGLLTIDSGALLALNTVPEIGVFTHYDGMAVNADTLVAGVKIAPVAMPQATLDAALSALPGPIIEVAPFRPLTVTCVVAEELQGRIRDRFEEPLLQKMEWHGAALRPIVWVPEDSTAIAAALDEAIPGSDLILTAGSHMMDPLDAILCALQAIDAPLVRLGAPAHPGSMVWLARHAASGTPILSLASCSMFSRSTVADLLMPYLFAGIEVTTTPSPVSAMGDCWIAGWTGAFRPTRPAHEVRSQARSVPAEGRCLRCAVDSHGCTGRERQDGNTCPPYPGPDCRRHRTGAHPAADVRQQRPPIGAAQVAGARRAGFRARKHPERLRLPPAEHALHR